MTDPEVIELILRSSWERYIAGYFWAAALSPGGLYRVLEDVIKTDAYPSAQEALKIASLLPRSRATTLFLLAEESTKKSTKRLTRKLEPVVRARARKYDAMLGIPGPGKKLTYKAGDGVKEVKNESVTDATFDEILGMLLTGARENRSAFKAAELLVYGRAVTAVDFSALEEDAAEAAEEAAPTRTTESAEPDS